MDERAVINGWVTLGSLLREARRDQQLTQAQAAAHAGVARSWLARVEAGHRGAELAPLMRLLDSLGLQLELGPAPAAAPSTARSS